MLIEAHIFTPRIVSELRLGYSRNRSDRLQFIANQNLFNFLSASRRVRIYWNETEPDEISEPGLPLRPPLLVS